MKAIRSNRNSPECYTRENAISCEQCKHLVVFGGTIGYCGYIIPRLTLRDTVKLAAIDEENDAKRCFFCDHRHLKLNSDTCSECLGTERLVHFKPEKDAPDWWIAKYNKQANKEERK